MYPGPWMHRGRRTRFFERGALKYLILDVIAEKPRHGYDIIREIEERTGGYYSPSPGTVYPTLQMLEDIGHLRVKEENGKKVYELTDEGKAYIKEHKEKVKKHRERMSECCPPGSEERVNLMFELRKVSIPLRTRQDGVCLTPKRLRPLRKFSKKQRRRLKRS